MEEDSRIDLVIRLSNERRTDALRGSGETCVGRSAAGLGAKQERLIERSSQ